MGNEPLLLGNVIWVDWKTEDYVRGSNIKDLLMPVEQRESHSFYSHKTKEGERVFTAVPKQNDDDYLTLHRDSLLIPIEELESLFTEEWIDFLKFRLEERQGQQDLLYLSYSDLHTFEIVKMVRLQFTE